jgi:hypothetical protein
MRLLDIRASHGISLVGCRFFRLAAVRSLWGLTVYLPGPFSGSSTLAIKLGSRFPGGSWDITRRLLFPVISTTYRCDGDLWCGHEAAENLDWSIMIWGLLFCGSWSSWKPSNGRNHQGVNQEVSAKIPKSPISERLTDHRCDGHLIGHLDGHKINQRIIFGLGAYR